MLWAFLYLAGTSCILLLVCAQSPEVYIVKGGMSSVSALKSLEYRPACFLPLQTSCATLLPASIAQVLVTSQLAPHFRTTPSQQGGSQMKYKSVSELKRSTFFKWWKHATQRRHPVASEVVARQSLQSVGTSNHCTWCHSKVVVCSVPTALWLVVTSFSLSICKFAVMCPAVAILCVQGHSCLSCCHDVCVRFAHADTHTHTGWVKAVCGNRVCRWTYTCRCASICHSFCSDG